MNRNSSICTLEACEATRFSRQKWRRTRRRTSDGGAPDPATASRCALCHGDIAPDKEGWLAHLLDAPGCPSNPRTNGAVPAEAAAS